MLEKADTSLPDDYKICLIDEPIYHMCKSKQWSYDLVSQFSDYKDYLNFGLGIAILKDKQIVSGASSYSRYKDGIEILYLDHGI